MEINVKDENKLVEVWLTNEEKKDPALRERLKPFYQKYAQQKYLVAVFQSGERELVEATADLLCYNRKRLAEQTVQQEGQQRMGIGV